MFCEKCGNQLEENSKFCTKCGTPVAQPVEETVAQPQTQPIEEPTPQPQAQPIEGSAPQPQFQQAPQPTPVAPKPPKKPMPKKIKNLIIFGSIGLGVIIIALIALFAFIIPELSKVDASKYITAKIDSYELYEGRNTATVKFDYEKMENELFGNSGYISQISRSSALEYALTYCTLDVSIDGTGEVTDSYGHYAEVKNLSSSDTITVKVTWDNTDGAKKSISDYESQAKVKFDKSDKTVTLKVSDELEKQSVTLAEIVNVDLLGKITDDNGTNHLKSVGTKNNINLKIEDFSFEQDGYTFAYTQKNGAFRITDAKGIEVDDAVYVSISDYYNVKAGAKVTLSLYSDSVYDTNIFFTNTELDTTVPDPEALTAETAKANIETIKKFFEDHSYNSSTKLGDIYFLENTDKNGEYENIIVFEYTQKLLSKTYYYSYPYANCYIDGDELRYGDYLSGTSGESQEDLEKKDEYLSDTTYKKTKIS